jgi:hypothetical protein
MTTHSAAQVRYCRSEELLCHVRDSLVYMIAASDDKLSKQDQILAHLVQTQSGLIALNTAAGGCAPSALTITEMANCC